jgi:flavodoxin
MKTLVIYYSLEGNTKYLAGAIAGATGADILELKAKKDLVKIKGIGKYFWGGRQVIMKKKPDLLPFAFDPAQYDLIFIGTPVWAFSYAPPLCTFFSTVGLKNKKIALFCSHGGGMGKTLEHMKKQVAGNTIVGTIDFFEPLKNKPDECAQRAKQWASGILITNS